MKKKIIKYFSILSLFLVLIVIYEMIHISTKIANRSTLTFDLNNIRNPTIEKMMRYLDDTYAYFLFFNK